MPQLLRTNVITDRQRRHCGFPLPRPQHLLIAKRLPCNSFDESASTQLGIIAQHWGYAGSARKAISYWLKAAEKSIDRSAIADAQVQLEKGLEPLSAMSDEADRRRHELALQPPLAGTDGRKGPFNTGNGSGSAAGPSAVRRLGRDERASTDNGRAIVVPCTPWRADGCSTNRGGSTCIRRGARLPRCDCRGNLSTGF
jgi:hypothetical protein